MKKSINQAHLRNGTYKEIVSFLENEFKLNGSEAPDEPQTITVTQQATQRSPEKLKPTCHHRKKQEHSGNQCR